MSNDLNHGQPTALETLAAFETRLKAITEHMGDPAELVPAVNALVKLVEEGFPRLSEMDMGPDEKVKMGQVQGQIAEMEQILQMRGSMLSGFSLHLKEMIQG